MKHFSLNTKSLKGLSYGVDLRPSRDWLILLAFIFVCLLMSVVWNLWMFGKVTAGETIGTGGVQQPPNAAPVDEVGKLFEERALEEARYKGEYHFVDPSTRGR
jgi:hypothetical protein